MSTFKVLGGDFPSNTNYSGLMGIHQLIIPTGFFKSDSVMLDHHIVEIEQITEENKTSVLGKAGWGTVGALALGPLGFLAGVFLGGKSQSVYFVCKLDDGRQFMAEADKATYMEIYSVLVNKDKPSSLDKLVEITAEKLEKSKK